MRVIQGVADRFDAAMPSKFLRIHVDSDLPRRDHESASEVSTGDI
jgi:hypothetical protein